MMTPSLSEEVSFCCDSFHVTTWMADLWPSSVWFIDRLLACSALPGWADTAVLLACSSFSTFSSPSSPPTATYPWSLFQAIQFNRVLFGIAICGKEAYDEPPVPETVRVTGADEKRYGRTERGRCQSHQTLPPIAGAERPIRLLLEFQNHHHNDHNHQLPSCSC
uniref:Uncharacterized protein n=1 Tax=Anopheles coluzzii TaxID=1518534 RepID=A0A8W7Q0I8_ANOCL